MDLRCPCCGAALDLELAPVVEEAAKDASERRDAWARAEDAALLREAERGQ